jgi:Icc-related predicted phosphoesterase
MRAARAAICALLAICLIPGCTGPGGEPQGSVINAGGRTYRVEGGALVRDGSPAGPGSALLGVVCDLEGDASSASSLASQLAGVDAVLVCGDICDHFRDPGPDDAELERALEPFLAAGLLVLAIPGNHEGAALYREAVSRLSLRHPNLVDMTQVPVAELGGTTVVALPGYHDGRFLAPGGYPIQDADYEAAVRRAQARPGPLVLLTHGPPLSSSERGVDQVEGGSHVGDPRLSDAFARGGFAVHAFGHIHESGGRAETPDGSPVPQGAEVARLLVNAAPARPWTLLGGARTKGQAAIVRLGNGTASYRIISVERAAPSAAG